jgi:hypothetical protein
MSIDFLDRVCSLQLRTQFTRDRRTTTNSNVDVAIVVVARVQRVVD